MEKEVEKELKEKYEKLPQKLKEALSSPEVSKRVLEIGGRFNLPEEKLEDLAMLSTMVLMRILPLSDLAEELKEELEIEDKVSKNLAQNLDSEVFSNYKDKLEKFYKSKEAAEAEEIEEEKPVEKIEIKEELLKKKGSDKYREPIEKTEETEQARIVKEGGKIKKIF